MRNETYKRLAQKRIRKAEETASAAIQRAFTQVIAVLQREKTEYIIHKQRTARRRMP